MTVLVNSKPTQLPDPSSVQQLVETLQLTQRRVAVEVNRELVVKREWPNVALKEGDRVEIVSFVGGG